MCALRGLAADRQRHAPRGLVKLLDQGKIDMDTVLIGGTLIDGTGREPMPGAGVVVKGKVTQ